MIFLTVDYQQGSSFGVLCIHFDFGPRIEVRSRSLEQGRSRRGNRKCFIELLRLVLPDHIRKREPELVVGEWNSAAPVRGVLERRRRRAKRREWKGQDAAERRGVDRDRRHGNPAPCEDLRKQTAKRVSDDRRWLVEFADDILEVIGDLTNRLVREDLRVLFRL